MLTFLGARICLGSMVEMLVLHGDVMPVQNSWWLAWCWKVGMKDPPKSCLRALECVQLCSHDQLCSFGGFYSPFGHFHIVTSAVWGTQCRVNQP